MQKIWLNGKIGRPRELWTQRIKKMIFHLLLDQISRINISIINKMNLQKLSNLAFN